MTRLQISNSILPTDWGTVTSRVNPSSRHPSHCQSSLEAGQDQGVETVVLAEKRLHHLDSICTVSLLG